MMKNWRLLIPCICAAACDAGKDRCVEDSGALCDTGDADADADADSDADADVDTDADVDLIDDAELTFSAHRHPCAGNRTDALWVDSGTDAWVGCGTTTAGRGLFRSTDGGSEWTEVDGFEDMRVNHLWREMDEGPLYVSGNSTVGDQRVVSYDGSLVDVWRNGSTSEMSFSVGAFAMASDGTQVAESLTGNGVVVRGNDTDWMSGYGWWSQDDHAAVQIMDLDVAGGAIVGAGNVISEPPAVYLPPRDWSFGALDSEGQRATGLWEIVELDGGSEDVIGELWDIDGDHHGLVVGGVDQVKGSGTLWTIGSDWTDKAYQPSAWMFTDVADVTGSGQPTWIRGVCRRGSRIAAVGEYSTLGDGLVLMSQDGGRTFVDRTAEVEASLSAGAGLGPLHRCQFLNNGELFAAGADGLFIRHTQ